MSVIRCEGEVFVPNKWMAINYSLQGAGHLKSGRPCEDYSMIKSYDNMFIGMVADGHSSAKNSAIGSKAICDAGIEVADEIVADKYTEADIKRLFSSGEIYTRLIDIWVRNVKEACEKENIELSLEENKRENLKKFGTTFLLALVTEKYVYFAYIGDGGVAYVRKDGEMKLLVDIDAGDMISESVCHVDRKEYLMSGPHSKSDFECIALMSDGFYKSYYKALKDIFKDVKDTADQAANDDNPEYFKKEVKDFMVENTQPNVNDDVSFAFLRLW